MTHYAYRLFNTEAHTHTHTHTHTPQTLIRMIYLRTCSVAVVDIHHSMDLGVMEVAEGGAVILSHSEGRGVCTFNFNSTPFTLKFLCNPLQWLSSDIALHNA